MAPYYGITSLRHVQYFFIKKITPGREIAVLLSIPVVQDAERMRPDPSIKGTLCKLKRRPCGSKNLLIHVWQLLSLSREYDLCDYGQADITGSSVVSK